MDSFERETFLPKTSFISRTVCQELSCKYSIHELDMIHIWFFFQIFPIFPRISSRLHIMWMKNSCFYFFHWKQLDWNARKKQSIDHKNVHVVEWNLCSFSIVTLTTEFNCFSNENEEIERERDGELCCTAKWASDLMH